MGGRRSDAIPETDKQMEDQLSFVLTKKNPIVKNWPVTIPVPMDDGAVRPHKIGLDFEIPPADDVIERLGTLSADVDSDRKAKDFLAEMTHGWHDVVHEDKSPVEFTEEGFRQLLNLPFAGPAIQAAYLDCLRGRKAKN